jgi:hypothetical protein
MLHQTHAREGDDGRPAQGRQTWTGFAKTDVARDFNTPDGDFQILLTAATPEKKVILKRLERELTRNYR